MAVTGSLVYGRPRFDVFSDGGINDGPPRPNGSFTLGDYKTRKTNYNSIFIIVLNKEKLSTLDYCCQ